MGLEKEAFIPLSPFPVSFIDSGHVQTAVVEVEPLNAIQCDMLEELNSEGLDRGMGTEEWGTPRKKHAHARVFLDPPKGPKGRVGSIIPAINPL